MLNRRKKPLKPLIDILKQNGAYIGRSTDENRVSMITENEEVVIDKSFNIFNSDSKLEKCIFRNECQECPDDCTRYIDESNVAYGTLASEYEYMPNTINIGYNLPDIKSHLKIGNMIIHNTKHFNWFHRKMWKLFFGVNIENVKEDDYD